MQNQDGMMWHGGEVSCAAMPKDAPSRSGHGRCWELPLNLLKMSVRVYGFLQKRKRMHKPDMRKALTIHE